MTERAVSGMGFFARVEAYGSLMSRTTTLGLSAEAAIRHIERLAGLSYGLRREEGLERAVALGGELAGRGLGPGVSASLHAALAGAWERLRLLRRPEGGERWEWEHPEVERQLRHLRLSLSAMEAARGVPREEAARVLSNCAALLDHVGRPCEAIEHWDRAVSVSPSLAVARGKRGHALTHYAMALYDRNQVEFFLGRARADLEEALASGVPPEAEEVFRGRLLWVSARSAGKMEAGLIAPPAGGGEEEAYRRWCLENRLFLNPLNDLGPYMAGAGDSMMPPPEVASCSGSDFYHGGFNQLKQTFVSARYLFYEGANAKEPHFADRGVALFDTRDYPSYSVSVEKMKAAFSMACSTFDRIADFLNRYLALGIPPEKATFRSIWREGQSGEGRIRREFLERRNWPMKGLFWLGKDLHENGFGEPLDPDAALMADIRTNIERKCLKLHEWYMEGDTGSPPSNSDPMAFSLYRGDFEARCLRVLRLARCALLYLCLSIHSEQKTRAGQKTRGGKPSPGPAPLLRLGPIEGGWRL